MLSIAAGQDISCYYNIILTDCGTGLMHSAMAGVLDTANALVGSGFVGLVPDDGVGRSGLVLAA